LILVAAALLIVAFGGAAALVVPKWQRSRQIAQFERDGLRASEEGRHSEALVLLSRYVRGVGEANVEPEVFLALARSRRQVQAPLDAHFEAAVSHYRAYLRLVPDDKEVIAELISALAGARQWSDVIAEAARIRPSDPSSAPSSMIPVLREEARARAALRPTDPQVSAIEQRLLSEHPPAFVDIWRACMRRQRAGDQAGVITLAKSIVEKNPDTLQSKLLNVMLIVPSEGGAPTGEPNQLILWVQAQMGTLLGIGPQAAPGVEPDLSDAELVRVVLDYLDSFGQAPMGVELLERSSVTRSDADLLSELARRYLFLERFEDLASLDPKIDGRHIPDVLGYQAYVAIQDQDVEDINAIRRELEAVEANYRAAAWLDVIKAQDQLRSGVLPEARATMARAVEKHALDPVIRRLQGDIFAGLEQYDLALTAWHNASLAADRLVWVDPMLRRADLLVELHRASEAQQIVDDALAGADSIRYIAHPHFPRLVAGVAASRGMLLQAPVSDLERAADYALLSAESDPKEQAARLGLDVIRCLILINEERRAYGVRLLSRFFQECTDPHLIAEARALDWQFGLGAALAAGLNEELPSEVSEAEIALVMATGYANGRKMGPDRVTIAAQWFDRIMAGAKPSDRVDWLLARAKFLSAFQLERAKEAWEEVLAAGPDRLDVLSAAVQSAELGLDRAFVEKSITKIREITQTQGRELPGHLRLARGRAIFGGADTGTAATAQSRDEAVSVLRSVVAAEPRNLLARKTLAFMLAAEPSPGSEAYAPDLVAAIAQLQAASALVSGPALINILFDIEDLAVRLPDGGDLSRQTLTRIAELIQQDTDAVEIVADRLRRSGNFVGAIAMYEQAMAGMTGPQRADVGVLLARTYAALGETAAANRLLDSLAMSDGLTIEQVVAIADELAANGSVERARGLLTGLARFGFRPAQQRYIRAMFDLRFTGPEEAESGLREAVAMEPTLILAWKALAELLLSQNRGDEASEVLADALTVHPDDADLIRLAAIARGDIPSSFDASAREAFEMVRRFEQSRGSMPVADQIEFLRSLGSKFPTIAAVQAFALPLRLDLNDDPAAIAADARRAALRFPENAKIAAVAAQATLLSAPPEEAIPLIRNWRGLETGSRRGPDTYLAAAQLDARNPRAALETIRPYLEDSIKSPNEPLNAQTIVLWARAQLRLGNRREVLEQLTPIVRTNEQFRWSSWLDIVTAEAPDTPTAIEWMGLASQAGGPGEFIGNAANAWLRLSARFPNAAADLLRRSISLTDGIIESGSSDLQAIVSRAEALSRLATLDVGSADSLHRQAAAAFLRADQIEPSDLNFLFGAARSADRAGDRSEAIQHYRTLLARPNCTGFFRAAVQNNLAMVIVKTAPTDTQLVLEAVSLAEQAVAFRSLGGFVSTRGWAKLIAGDAAGATADFTTATGSDPGSAESWAGLAVALKVSGADETRVNAALKRANELRGEAPFEHWISDALSAHGLQSEG